MESGRRSAMKSRGAEGGRGRQREAEGGRGRQREAEGGRGRQREAEGGRGRQREGKGGAYQGKVYGCTCPLGGRTRGTLLGSGQHGGGPGATCHRPYTAKTHVLIFFQQRKFSKK
jgi:hypothetical protein